MNITATITGIEYTLKLENNLTQIDFDDFNINKMPSSCLVKCNKFIFGMSKWVSPKRTRSYPFERVYNTLKCSKRITVIPVIKDEGKNGDRDFIQWDTISLMSLLDVFVIFAFYRNAEKHKSRANKVSNQTFDNDLVISKINEIKNYHSSALHWNLKEIENELPKIIDKTILSYQRISKKLNVEFHSLKGIENFKRKFDEGLNEFMKYSRDKAKSAQNREMQTLQPKEFLDTDTKATITISNYLGGKYYLTIDEIEVKDKVIYLIEAKHSQSNKLPSKGDIKDALLKMILYCNLENTIVMGENLESIPVLKLTSNKLKGKLYFNDSDDVIRFFTSDNELNKNEIQTINLLFLEANVNKFEVQIVGIK